MTKRSWMVVALAPLATSAVVAVLSLLEASPALKLVLFGSSWMSAAIWHGRGDRLVRAEGTG